MNTDDYFEPVVLVGVVRSNQNAGLTNDYLDELAFLAETAGGKEVKRYVQAL